MQIKNQNKPGLKKKLEIVQKIWRWSLEKTLRI